MATNLTRFTEAQEADYPIALKEISNGQKRSHWMWYIFPQIAGLGFSQTSLHYAISHREEAKAYLAHPVLGPRLVEISHALLKLPTSDATRVMGSPDDLKLRSSMTLFAEVEGADPVFAQVLDKFFQGESDAKTLELLD